MWDQQVYIRGLLKFLDAIDQGAQAVTF